MPVCCADIWNNVLEKLRETIPAKSFNTWMTHTSLESVSDEKALIGVPNLFIKEWLRDHYGDLIADNLRSETGSADLSVDFHIDGENFQSLRRKVEAENKKSDAVLAGAPILTDSVEKQKASAKFVQSGTTFLNSKNTFDQFISGPVNTIACEACRMASSTPGEFSPLFISGGSGTGKTHLLQAVCHEADENEFQVCYMTAERFTTEFSIAVEKKCRPEFQAALRGCDILVIDDIQHFTKGNRAATQEEFMHTVDALCNSGKQVVLACDRDFRELEGLNENLSKRLMAGLCLKLDTPDQKTAEAIIGRKAVERGIALDGECVAFVAENYGSCARELEGAISKLAAFARFSALEMNKESVVAILGKNPHKADENASAPPQTATLAEIASATADAFGLKSSDLCGRKRSQRIREARALAMMLARDVSGASFAEIGAHFGGRSHATALTSISGARKLVKSDLAIERKVRLLRKKLGGQSNLF